MRKYLLAGSAIVGVSLAVQGSGYAQTPPAPPAPMGVPIHSVRHTAPAIASTGGYICQASSERNWPPRPCRRSDDRMFPVSIFHGPIRW